MSPALLSDDAAWVKAYRGQLPQQQKPEGEAVLANPLNVEYDCQLNNPSGDGWRECFSSSCAMAAKFWGVIDDHNYHRLRPKYGDSTDASAQVRTLQALGLTTKVRAGRQRREAQEQIDLGRPTPGRAFAPWDSTESQWWRALHARSVTPTRT